MVTETSAMDRTRVSSVAVLFARLMSLVVDETVTVSVIIPTVEASTDTFTVNCLELPAGIVPSVHVTIPATAAFGSSAHPTVDMKVTPAGSVSTTNTFCASEGPPFVTVTLYVIVS